MHEFEYKYLTSRELNKMKSYLKYLQRERGIIVKNIKVIDEDKEHIMICTDNKGNTYNYNLSYKTKRE